MKDVIQLITDEYYGDPVVFGWLRAFEKKQWNDKEALYNLVAALIAQKAVCLKVIDSLKNKDKVLEFKRK
jgi:hypothetical protein